MKKDTYAALMVMLTSWLFLLALLTFIFTFVR
jgi:hypothetical protein